MEHIISAIDMEINRLREVRELLTLATTTPTVENGGLARTQGKHQISPEGRARIAAAQRRRWARVKRNKRDEITF